LGLTACGGATEAPSVGSTTAMPSCVSAPLAITLVDLTVRAVNMGQRRCALAGDQSVTVPWWRIVGAGPSPAVGTLAPGSVLVQSYKAEGGNGCPWPGGSGGTAQISVYVEGKAHVLSLPAKLVYEITRCDMVSVLAPMIQPPQASSS
jgi:hypothetical protein